MGYLTSLSLSLLVSAYVPCTLPYNSATWMEGSVHLLECNTHTQTRQAHLTCWHLTAHASCQSLTCLLAAFFFTSQLKAKEEELSALSSAHSSSSTQYERRVVELEAKTGRLSEVGGGQAADTLSREFHRPCVQHAAAQCLYSSE